LPERTPLYNKSLSIKNSLHFNLPLLSYKHTFSCRRLDLTRGEITEEQFAKMHNFLGDIMFNLLVIQRNFILLQFCRPSVKAAIAHFD
jgi:CRISPR/Cas system-associated protein endoribonuclease Cas2